MAASEDSLSPLHESVAKKKRGPYKPKNQLDGFLRFVVGGKYKWRRYEIFEDYLIRFSGLSKDDAKAVISKYQSNGVDRVYLTMTEQLQRWKHICNEARASKAGKAKAAKHRKWSQARRKKFTLKRLESSLGS
jgi:hypothetical protein